MDTCTTSSGSGEIRIECRFLSWTEVCRGVLLTSAGASAGAGAGAGVLYPTMWPGYCWLVLETVKKKIIF